MHTLPASAGHIVTPRGHSCGEFRDDFDWSSLPPSYQRSIGYPGAPARG